MKKGMSDTAGASFRFLRENPDRTMRSDARTIVVLTILAAASLSCGTSERDRSATISVQRFDRSPLTALVRYTTPLPSTVAVTVKGQDGNDLTNTGSDTAAHHEIPVIGLYPGCTNTVVITATFPDGTQRSDTLSITTDALPPDYSHVRLLSVDHDRVSPGFVYIVLSREYGGSIEESMPVAVDNFGKVRWACIGDYWYWGTFTGQRHFIAAKQTRLDLLSGWGRAGVERVLHTLGLHEVAGSLYWVTDNQDFARGVPRRSSLFRSLCEGIAGMFPSSWMLRNTLVEFDLFGRELRSWKVEGGVFHHDATFLPNGNLLALVFTPDDDTDRMMEIETGTNRIVRTVDFRDVLDRHRPQSPWHTSPTDWSHPNGLVFSPHDSSVIVSARNQSAVVKFGLEAADIRWIMGAHDYWPPRLRQELLQPVGGAFRWQWGQHAPVLSPSDPGRILLFDNGNYRSYEAPLAAASNYSRAVEYRVDEAAATVRQLWQYGEERGSELYSPVVGNAVYLQNGNRLICFGAISRDSSGKAVEWVEADEDSAWFRNRRLNSSVRIIEVSGDTPARVYLELAIEDDDPTDYIGYLAYRAYRWE